MKPKHEKSYQFLAESHHTWKYRNIKKIWDIMFCPLAISQKAIFYQLQSYPNFDPHFALKFVRKI